MARCFATIDHQLGGDRDRLDNAAARRLGVRAAVLAGDQHRSQHHRYHHHHHHQWHRTGRPPLRDPGRRRAGHHFEIRNEGITLGMSEAQVAASGIRVPEVAGVDVVSMDVWP